MAIRTARNCTMGSGMTPFVVISPRGERRIESGHPWIYRGDVVEVKAEPGDLVVVRNVRSRTLGRALFSDRSQIAVRMLTFGEAPPGDDWLRERLQAAFDFRATLGIAATAYRLVHGEGDRLP